MPLTSLAGNHALKEQLRPRLSGGTLGHALILSGPAGSGKHTLAAILSRAMVCEHPGSKPCGSCPACKKALAGIHPDIITIVPEPGKTAINVDQVRQMRADAHIRPNEANRKVYLLEQADHLRGEAQNAMLKLLEEGPVYAAFLLLCENSGNLLPTVRSRCETLALTLPQQGDSRGDEQTAALAHELVRLWLEGDEIALMEQSIRMEKEKWERQQFLTLTEQMTARFCAILPAAADRRRVLKGIQLMEELRAATAQNVGVGALSGWLCAACAKE